MVNEESLMQMFNLHLAIGAPKRWQDSKKKKLATNEENYFNTTNSRKVKIGTAVSYIFISSQFKNPKCQAKY